MKVNKLVYFVIALFTIFSVSAYSGIAVQAVGRASFKSTNAEDEALRSSMRRAVEKSLGAIGNQIGNDEKAASAIDKILSKPESYIVTYQKVRQWREGTTIKLKINAVVDVQRIEDDFRSLLKSVSAKLDHPVIAFALTAFETKEYSRQKRHIEGQILIDAFQAEFTDKGFDIIAADDAREFAANHSGKLVEVISGDRKQMARYARKIGANFVARGELQVTYHGIDAATGANKYTGTISCEIIESATKELVAGYSNTVTKQFPDKVHALSATMQTAARNAAGKLSQQTLDSWKATAEIGKTYSITFLNVYSHRKQSRKVEQALEKYAKIRNSRYDRKEKKFTIDIVFKGTSKEIEDILFNDSGLESFENFDLIKLSGNSLFFTF